MSSITRISGLASGMDIDKMVSDLMKAQRAQVDKIKQNKQIAEWQQEDYRDINTSLDALRSTVFNMKLQGIYLAKKATSSNESIVKVTASTSAVAAMNTIKVTALAANARLNSISDVNFDSGKTTLHDQFNLTTSGEIKFKVADDCEEITVNLDTDTIDTLITKINNAKKASDGKTSAGVCAFFDKTLKRMFISSTSTGSGAQIHLQNVSNADELFNKFNLNISSYDQPAAELKSITPVTSFDNTPGLKLVDQMHLTDSSSFTFTINNSGPITFNPLTQNMDDLVAAINSAGVNASYDYGTNVMTISPVAPGTKVDINLVNGPDEVFKKLNLGITSPFDAVYGTDAKFELNGVSLSESTNQFSIAGINYTLTGTSDSQTVNVNVTNDTDTVFNSIKSFIDLYNSTLDKVNKELSEKRYKDYLPLTDDQREQLSDDQEKKWEEKAKSGLLNGDSLLSGIAYKMRTTMFSTVSSVSNAKYSTLPGIGITTLDYSENGKLYIDENKLKDALNKDPNSVMELFTANPDDQYSHKGIAQRLYDDLNGAIKSITDKAGKDYDVGQYDNSTLGKQINEYAKEIDSWEDRLSDIEDRYYKQFTAMEEALNKMNSQSAWLAQQFGGSK